jgi:outer membrane cobalamin receptor
VFADFRFRFQDLRSDWTWKLGERHMLLFGGSLNRTEAEYDYSLTGYLKIPTAPNGQYDISHAHQLDVSGSRVGAHAAWRARAVNNLVVEAGLRWDQYRYPDGLQFSVVSPRLNTVFDLGEHGELRAAYGVQHQPHRLHELQVEDNVTSFFEPERARQAVLGYTTRFATDWSARVDVYQKEYSRLRPRFENALDPMQLIPEGAVDRVRIDAPEAEARGVEITLRREAERGFAGWASLVLAKVEEDVVAEGWTPRTWDQRHGVSFGISWTGAKWNVNFGGLYHGGTPTTKLGYGVVTTPAGQDIGVIVAGPRNGDRVGDYARLDLRASRAVQMRSGKFSYYLEVTNLLNRENPCCVQAYHLESDGVRSWLYQEQGNWLPMLPSFGFQFEF